MSANGEALRLEGVRKSFGKNEVLKGIDLDLAEHEVVCLIGASGSGKSTLLRCVNLLEPIDEGRIVVLGEEITAHGVKVNEVRRRIGIVFQSYNLFPHMSVLRNVTLAPRRVLGVSKDVAEVEATALLGRFGLADRRDEYPDRLSGGQQQRVAIVRALAMRPELMLLDEVTSALDPELVAEVLNVIRELAEGGMTMLIATHEMSFARDIASRVCFLDAGRILEQGPPTEIFSAPRSRGRNSSSNGSSRPDASKLRDVAELVVLEVVGSEPEAELICSFLRSAGIPCIQQPTNFAVGAGDGLAVVGPREIVVREENLDEARDVLRQQRPLGTDDID